MILDLSIIRPYFFCSWKLLDRKNLDIHLSISVPPPKKIQKKSVSNRDSPWPATAIRKHEKRRPRRSAPRVLSYESLKVAVSVNHKALLQPCRLTMSKEKLFLCEITPNRWISIVFCWMLIKKIFFTIFWIYGISNPDQAMNVAIMTITELPFAGLLDVVDQK